MKPSVAYDCISSGILLPTLKLTNTRPVADLCQFHILCFTRGCSQSTWAVVCLSITSTYWIQLLTAGKVTETHRGALVHAASGTTTTCVGIAGIWFYRRKKTMVLPNFSTTTTASLIKGKMTLYSRQWPVVSTFTCSLLRQLDFLMWHVLE